MEYDNLPENVADFKIENIETAENKLETIEDESEDDFDDLLEKVKIKDQILRYSNSFAKYLTAYREKIEDMDSLPIDKLKTLQREVQIAVSARTSGNLAKNNFIALVSVTETVAPILGMNLTGLSNLLAQNQDINECLEELNIKYDVMNYVPPEVRLLFITANTALLVNSENKKIEKIANILNEQVQQDHIQEFADL